MFSGNAIFIKYYYLGQLGPKYKESIIPGAKKGISASNLGGTYVGINIHSDIEKRMAAVKILQFILSKDTQKKIIMEKHAFSGVKELYFDEDVCSVISDCELQRNIQLLTRYQFLRPDYVAFSDQFRHYAYEYLYGNKTVTEVLNNINDMTRIYYFTIDTEYSVVGLVYFIALVVFLVMILLSLIFCTSKKYYIDFIFLPKPFWHHIFLGFVSLVGYSFLEFGKVSVLKCHLQLLLLSVGFTLIFIPTLCKLIINFPEKNKFSTVVDKYKYLFIHSFLFLDGILNALYLIKPYKIKTFESYTEKNYQECLSDNGIFERIIFYTIITLKSLSLLAILFLCFIEWNLDETRYDIRFLTSDIYINIVLISLVIIIKLINTNNYGMITVIYKGIIIILLFSNYFFFFGIRILLKIINKKDKGVQEEKRIISYLQYRKRLYDSTTIKSSEHNGENSVTVPDHCSTSSSMKSKVNKIISYHYQKSLDNVASTHKFSEINITSSCISSNNHGQ